MDRELFVGLVEARVLVEEFRREYNEERPHSSLDYQTPKTFAAACKTKTLITLSTEVIEEVQNRTAMDPGIPSAPELAAAGLS